jgi:gamma-glutamylcyclotransferase (GGCT)/AIG2-like uncharacterized protein YtfP
MLGALKKTVFPWLEGRLHRVHGPDAQWMGEAIKQYPNTPDVWILGSYEYQLVFVYGSQMRGHPQHELMNNEGAFAATAYTDNRFELWRKELGSATFPIALAKSNWSKPDWNRASPQRVQGELYAVSTPQLIRLDNHFQNTLEFRRKRVPLVVPYRHLFEVDGRTDIQRKIAEITGAKLVPEVVQTDVNVQMVKAWMYIGDSKYWGQQLSHFFQPAPVYQSRVSWLGDYTAFTRTDVVK